MSTANNRRADPGTWTGETLALLAFVLISVIGGGSLYAAIRLGHHLEGTTEQLPTDPFAVVIGLFTGKVTWPATGTWIMAAAGGIVLVVAVLFFLAWRKGRSKSSRVDRAASVMGTGKDIEGLSKSNATAAAARWNLTDVSIGVPIGRTVASGQPLFATWEDMHLDIWGPRTGKTTSRAVPAILEAPGAVLGTSNKRDLVDATRDIRAEIGPVWVFDPQGIVREEPSWWWNPLTYVTDEVRAADLASHFASGSLTADSKRDPYFDPTSNSLIAGLLLAAALDNRPITDVYIWATRPSDEEPVDILARYDYPLIEAQVSGIIALPDKQRAGVYGSAQTKLDCLTNRKVAHWVTPANGGFDTRPQFDPEAFVRGKGTLYSLSREGKGTAGPLVTALTVAVIQAAEDFAETSPNGRLPVPLLGVLDEIANVCRWSGLPDLYSHYGSRGIVLMAILQSWSQGVEVWGDLGMKKLFSATNVFVYGGGARESGMLEDLTKLIGEFERVSTSTSSSRGNRTVSRQLVRHRILDVDELAALPRGRAVVFSSGGRATLIRTQPWFTGPHATAVKASIAAHDPQATTTILEAETTATEDTKTFLGGSR